MKSNLLVKSKKIALVIGMTVLGLSSKAAVILQSNTNNAQSITITTPTSGVTQYNYVIPYFESTLISPASSFIFRASSFTCGLGYSKIITCTNTSTNLPVSGTANGTAGTFTLNTSPSALGTTYYTIKTSCYHPLYGTTNIVNSKFCISITRATAPVINSFSLSSSCNQSLNTSTMQYQNNGSASLYVETGNFSNVQGMKLRYTKQDGTFTDKTFAQVAQEQYPTFFSHSSINNDVAAGTHILSLVYKYKSMYTTSTGVPAQNASEISYFPVSGSTDYPSIVFTTLTKVLSLSQVICLPPAPRSAKVIYPNTVQEHINVKAEGEKIKSVTVYDLTNNVIKKVSFTNGNEEEKIDMYELQRGMYILEIETETSTERKQIIKE